MTNPPLDELMGGQLAAVSAMLTALPEPKFLAVVEQLTPLVHIPTVALLFDACRPRLRKIRPHRPLTLKRLFCRPFEDLLVTGPCPEGFERLRIPRAAITPCWNVVAGRIAGEIATLQANLRDLPAATEKSAFTIAERLWDVSGRALADAPEPVAGPSPHPALMRDALLAAPVIERFKREVPAKPVATIGAEIKGRIVECFGELTTQQMPTVGFLLVIAARVKSPAELIELLGGTGAPVPEEIEAFAVTQLLDRVNRLDETIATAGPEGLAKEIDEVLNAMSETRNVVGKAIKTGLEQHARDMESAARAALDEHVIAAAPGALEAAFAESPEFEALIAAESHARALYRARKAAKRLGLGQKAEAMISAMRQRFEACIEEEMKMAAATGNSGQSPALFRAIRMIELVAGVDAARPLLHAALSGERAA
jgi:hypothetical protein